MRYFRIDPLGDDQNKALALIGSSPEELGIHDYCMARGERAGSRWPADARIYLQNKRPGFKLSSLLGNTKGYLIVSSEMKEVILEHCDADIELLSFTLYNHKKRVHSSDYWIINPIGAVDCVDEDASDIEYLDSGGKREVVSVERYVFDAERAAKAPMLFRVPQELAAYFVALPLARAFQQRGFTNVLLEEIKVNG